MNISGYRVIVTGASSGIGEACAKMFAQKGAHVAIVARRLERIEKLAESLQKEHGIEVHTAKLDVRDRDAVKNWADSLPDSWKAPDVLVNNAGLARGLAKLQEGSFQDWDEMIDTNIKGLLNVTRFILPNMVKREKGHVINIGSIAGHEVYPSGNVYCATKHAVGALNRAMGIDVLGTGVRVSSVDPGMVETEFSNVRFHWDEKKAESVYVGLKALEANDVAESVLFCATRPVHANIREMVLMPASQATATQAYRKS